MRKEEIIKELKNLYPGKNIVLNNESETTEIVCEIDPERGEAVAIIDASKPHYHRVTTERYLVLNGRLSLYVDGKRNILKKGEIYDIEPGVLHYAEGDSTWVKVISTPPWTADDHFEVEEDD